MKRQGGFTLVELVVVIVILGILAAVAFPRYISLTQDARFAAVSGMAGGLRSAVGVVQARYIANGGTGTSVTMLDSTAVTVNTGTGIPVGTALGIGAAMQSTDGFTPDYTTATAVTFTPNGAPATCLATYNGTTGVVTAPANKSSC